MYKLTKKRKADLKNEEIKENRKRNYKIFLEPQKVYDSFFHHGILGKDELLEGIIYFSYEKGIFNDVINEYIKVMKLREQGVLEANIKSETGEEILEKVIKKAQEIYLQFYRFVDLNDEDKIPDFYKIEKDRNVKGELEKRIRDKVKQLQEEKDDYVLILNKDRQDGKSDREIKQIKERNEIERTVNNKIKTLISYGRDVNSAEREKMYEEESKKYFGENKLKVRKDGISYSTRERSRYAHFPEYSLEDDIQPYVIRHWTEDVYDILNYLQKLEKKDKVEYYKVWLDTRIQRLKNRIEYQSVEKKKELQQEIELLVEARQKVEEIRKKENKGKVRYARTRVKTIEKEKRKITRRQEKGRIEDQER